MSNTIHLQAIGTKPAVFANELKEGDVTLWNFGAQELILERTKETEKSVWFKISGVNGYTGTRQLRKDRLVGILAGK